MELYSTQNLEKKMIKIHYSIFQKDNFLAFTCPELVAQRFPPPPPSFGPFGAAALPALPLL